MEVGEVKFFNGADNRRYGFIIVGREEIFFHLHDYDTGDGTKPKRMPTKGDKIAFERTEGRQGPKACPWMFQGDWKSKTKTIRLAQIPGIGRDQFQDGDVCVFDTEGTGDSPVRWITVVYRPSTGEFFKIRCKDGENGSYQPDLPDGKLPDGVTIVDR